MELHRSCRSGEISNVILAVSIAPEKLIHGRTALHQASDNSSYGIADVA